MLTAEEIALLQQWVGRQESATDTLTPAPLRGLLATLDHPVPDASQQCPVLPLSHWLYFLPQHRQSELGPDGHARRGGFLPPVSLPRRMWAGGRLHWNTDNPLRVGDALQRVSHIEAVTHKQGKSGELVFVLVRHEVSNRHGLALTEWHDIVYRQAAVANDQAPAPLAPPAQADWQREVFPDSVLLFRYSALTFNGHRIHYDRSHVQQEGYPGLVVHGPLMATLLLDLVHCHCPEVQVRTFRFRAVHPVYDSRPLRVCGKREAGDGKVVLWVQDHEGWLAMEAEATLR